MNSYRSKGIRKLYKDLIERLPSTYPKPSLVIHSSLFELNRFYWENFKIDNTDPGYPPYAFCVEDNSVHISPLVSKLDIKITLWVYLHEIGHLFALKKYGKNDSRWKDYYVSEKYADSFAYRWVKKLKMEGWFVE